MSDTAATKETVPEARPSWIAIAALADLIDLLTVYPSARVEVARVLEEIEAG